MDHVNTRLTWTCCFGWWNDKFKQRFVETFRWQGTFGSCESNVSHLWTHWPHLDGWDSLFEAENGLDVIPNCQKKHAKKYKFSVSKLTYSSPPKKNLFFCVRQTTTFDTFFAWLRLLVAGGAWHRPHDHEARAREDPKNNQNQIGIFFRLQVYGKKCQFITCLGRNWTIRWIQTLALI